MLDEKENENNKKGQELSQKISKSEMFEQWMDMFVDFSQKLATNKIIINTESNKKFS